MAERLVTKVNVGHRTMFCLYQRWGAYCSSDFYTNARLVKILDPADSLEQMMEKTKAEFDDAVVETEPSEIYKLEANAEWVTGLDLTKPAGCIKDSMWLEEDESQFDEEDLEDVEPLPDFAEEKLTKKNADRLCNLVLEMPEGLYRDKNGVLYSMY